MKKIIRFITVLFLITVLFACKFPLPLVPLPTTEAEAVSTNQPIPSPTLMPIDTPTPAAIQKEIVLQEVNEEIPSDNLSCLFKNDFQAIDDQNNTEQIDIKIGKDEIPILLIYMQQDAVLNVMVTDGAQEVILPFEIMVNLESDIARIVIPVGFIETTEKIFQVVRYKYIIRCEGLVFARGLQPLSK